MNYCSIVLFVCLNIEVIRGIINEKQQEAAKCDSLTNESLFIFLTFNDLLHYGFRLYISHVETETADTRTDEIRTKVEDVWNQTFAQCNHSNDEENRKLQQEIDKKNYYDSFILNAEQHRVRIIIETDIGHVQFQSNLNDSPKMKKMDSLWHKVIKANAQLQINYEIHSESFKAYFQSDGEKPNIFNDIDEILTVLATTSRIIDNKLEQECGNHHGSLLTKYRSLGLGDEFMNYLHNLDTIEGYDKLWQFFTNVVIEMEAKSKENYLIQDTNQKFQYPINVLAAMYKDNKHECAMEKTAGERMNGAKKRTVSFDAHVDGKVDVVDVLLK